jgi:fructuronate reductase
MRYVTAVDEQGRAIDVRDPLAVRLKAIADAAGPHAARLAPALLSVQEIFGRDLAADRRFVRPVTRALAELYGSGPRGTVAEFETWSADGAGLDPNVNR